MLRYFIGRWKQQVKSFETANINLVAVVGGVRPELLDAFIRHYSNLGLSDASIGFHFTGEVAVSTESGLNGVLKEWGIKPRIVSRGPWHETTNSNIRDAMIRVDGAGWHLLADVDEFHDFEGDLSTLINRANLDGFSHVEGVLVDRFDRSGEFPLWDPSRTLDETYELGGFFTHAVLRGDPRKVVLAKRGVRVAHGNHWCDANQGPAFPTVIPVHHFKWQAGIVEVLRDRMEKFTSGEWGELSSAVRDEAARFIDHVGRNKGRVDTTFPGAMFAPASTTTLRPDWMTSGVAVKRSWDQYFESRPSIDRLKPAKLDCLLD